MVRPTICKNLANECMVSKLTSASWCDNPFTYSQPTSTLINDHQRSPAVTWSLAAAGVRVEVSGLRRWFDISRLVCNERHLPRLRQAVQSRARLSARIGLFQLWNHGFAGRCHVLRHVFRGCIK